MNVLAFARDDFARLRSQLLATAPRESAAILYAAPALADARLRLLVRDVEVIGPDGCLEQEIDRVVLSPLVVARAMKRARLEGLSLIFAHSHPFSQAPSFSEVDDAGERELMPTVFRQLPDRPHGTLVIGVDGYAARIRVTPDKAMRVAQIDEIGPQVVFHHARDKSHFGQPLPLGYSAVAPREMFDRNVRAFGEAGQRLLERLRVGVVGLGGTGSVVVEQLAYLGFSNFLLLDPDVIETTNTNRVVGSVGKVGIAKVESAAALIRQIRPGATINAIQGAIHIAHAAAPILQADLIFNCTDTHGSRAVINQIAYQYLIPAFDVGIRIDALDGAVQRITGRAQMLAPGLPCLLCQELLDPEEVRRDLLSEDERERDPYIVGAREPQPAVISLNSTVASLAVTMALGALTTLPLPARHQLYLADRGVVRQAMGNPREDCIVCSTKGALGRGNTWSLPWRLA